MYISMFVVIKVNKETTWNVYLYTNILFYLDYMHISLFKLHNVIYVIFIIYEMKQIYFCILIYNIRSVHTEPI